MNTVFEVLKVCNLQSATIEVLVEDATIWRTPSNKLGFGLHNATIEVLVEDATIWRTPSNKLGFGLKKTSHKYKRGKQDERVESES
jgi:translation elongation factor EF-1beta